MPHLPASTDQTKIRVTAIETAIPADIMPGLMLLRIHTDAGFIGHGETYYAPHAVAAVIHDWMARRLLGEDALAIESHWRFLYERAGNFGGKGAELRALSAIDVALWDILGQACGQPIYRLLGGPVRDRVPIYNTCGGPTYGASRGQHQCWPGYGDAGQPGELQDLWSAMNRPGDLAEELLAEGYTAMKFWPFDYAAQRSGGLRISWADVEEAMGPLRAIRKRVGRRIELIVEGHAFFHLPAALRIAEACREIEPLWLEDVLRVDNIDTLADFRRQSRTPISASEMLLTRGEYTRLLEARAADFVMIDPTWNGGISETMRVAHQAQAYNLPVTMHDCTGPMTTLAGLQMAAALPNCTFQETVRAHLRMVYPKLIDAAVEVRDGQALLPSGPGIGARFHPHLFAANIEGCRISRARGGGA